MDAPPKKAVAVVRSWASPIKKARKLPRQTLHTQMRALFDGTLENYLHLLAVHETKGPGKTALDKRRKLLRQQWEEEYQSFRPLSMGPAKLVAACCRGA